MPKTEDKKSRHIDYDNYVKERLKKDSKFLTACLKSAFDSYKKDREITYLLDTLGQAASIKGVSNLSKETGISRQYLYKMLSLEGNPTFANVDLVAKAFGYGIEFKKLKTSN